MRRRTDPLLALPDKSGVLYIRLYQRMRALILQGSWPAGTRLPSSRRLAADLGISRNTATLALEQLLADGWIETRSRAGVFVSAELPHTARRSASGSRAQPRIGQPPVPFEMAHGAIDAFPADRWAKLQARVWSKAVPDLLYESDIMGDAGLRQAIADVVAPARGMTVRPEEVMIITSTHAALDLIAAILPPSSSIVVEDPGYVLADAAFTQRGHRIVAAPVDDEGLDVDAARAAEPRPALIFVTPSAHFPTGRPMSAERRRALLAWAEESGAWIVEDEFDAPFRFDGQQASLPLRSEAERVITVASFSRLLFNSLRLGFLVVPPALRGSLLQARRAVDQFINLPNQLVLAAFIEEGGFAAHVRRCRDLYRSRRGALLAMLEPYRGVVVTGEINPCGLHIVVQPKHVAMETLTMSLREAGIACMTVGDFQRRPTDLNGVMLGFAAFSPDVIEAMQPAIEQAFRPLMTREAAE